MEGMPLVCPSQFIPARKLWDGFNPFGFEKGVFVIFKGYIDESYGPERNIFTLSCILATGKDWDDFERRWTRTIAAKNRELVKAGRPTITRYHASDCSGRRNEFKKWGLDERDEFVKNLFKGFGFIPTFTVVFDVQMKELCEIFPEYAEHPLEASYHWLTRFLMLTIASDFQRHNPQNRPIKFTLFHDRTGGNGAYDPTILRAFNSLINDETFSGRGMFSTIAPLSWQDCVLLQLADLLAFENFKQAQARLDKRDSRKSFKALFDFQNFGIHSKTVNRRSLEALGELVSAARRKTP
jgi:hypothetical protein